MLISGKILSREWKKLDKTVVPDVASSVVNASRGGDKSVFVGCDSQMYNYKQEYVVSIVVYTERKGGTTWHVKIRTGKPRNLREKLVNEAWLAIQTAWELEHVLPKGVDLSVHLDINSDEKWASSKYHDEVYWLAKGQGFKVFTKPNAWAASYVSEFIAKRRNEAA